MATVTLKVDGMSCEHCVKAVNGAVDSVTGTSNVKVDLKSGSVTFAYEPSVSLDAVKAAIVEEGYEIVA